MIMPYFIRKNRGPAMASVTETVKKYDLKFTKSFIGTIMNIKESTHHKLCLVRRYIFRSVPCSHWNFWSKFLIFLSIKLSKIINYNKRSILLLYLKTVPKIIIERYYTRFLPYYSILLFSWLILRHLHLYALVL